MCGMTGDGPKMAIPCLCPAQRGYRNPARGT
jgi:hypothetical protein